VSDLPADLIRRGFRLRERDGQQVVYYNSRQPWRSRGEYISRPRVLLISERFGVAVGATLAEAIDNARAIARTIDYVNRKRAEEADVHPTD
jgi:hypothetical protein